ncbi:MAG: Peptide deformylase [Thermoleophilia bacterium]|nr:Peptide deformylase [Thermoleophilia bacterium]
MTVRPIVVYPDERLKTVCTPVGGSGPLAPDHRELALDLLETMSAYPGCVGLAAPQVGALVRMLAIDVTGHRRAKSCHGRVVLVDPELTARAGNVAMREGCLSIPDFTGNVRRPERITVTGRGVDGESLELHCDGYEARVLLHEIDHLDGLLFLDRVRKASDVFPRKHYQ